MNTTNVLGEKELSENVEQLRARLEAMKRLIRQEESMAADCDSAEGGILAGKLNANKKNKDSIIDGSFLSFVFGVVLIMIICVSIYAFQNLYYAILKKFPSRPHTEL